LNACDCRRPEWVEIPSSSRIGYRVFVRTYKDNESVAQPFKLGIMAAGSNGDIVQLLSVEQCKNVEVFQDKQTLSIFYDTLILDHFSGDSHGRDVPRPSLCDNAAAACQDERQAYLKRGVRGVSVCTLH
jgi:hypothetical protein